MAILREFKHDFREKLFSDSPDHLSKQWRTSLKYEANTVGELMQPAPLILNENQTIDEAITEVKKIPKEILFTYGFVVDDNNKLTGVLVFKDVFYYKPHELLKEVCFKNPVCLEPENDVLESFPVIAG